MKRIFVTHICPKDKIMEYGLSLSASYFNYNLIEGGGFDKVYSIYPGFVKGTLPKLDDDTFEAVYSKSRNNKLLSKFSRFIEQIKLFRKIPKSSNVWFYNITTLNVLLILLLRIFKPSSRLFLIILDYSPDKAFHKLVLPLINSMDGRICLSTSKRFKADNSVCLPGVIPKQRLDAPLISEIKPAFLLSGALNEAITMLSMVLESFSEMPELTLHLSGVLLEHEDLVKEYASRYDNIIFHGKLPYEKFKELLDTTPFSLNTRNPDFTENQCNFPSKVIEALNNNRIVISTIKYPQLEPLKYLYIGAEKENFKRDLLRIISKPQQELLTFANQGTLAAEMFNSQKWFVMMDKIENDELKKSI